MKLLLLSVAAAMMISSFISQLAGAAASYSGNETDKFALLEFKRRISDYPRGMLNSWNHSVHHCSWLGVTCDARHQRVTVLNLRGHNLFGSVSPYLGNLSSLHTLSLTNNNLEGHLPKELGKLTNLSFFSVSDNLLSGTFPPSIFNISTLITMSLTKNYFVGSLPDDIGLKMPNLQELSICSNEFYGIIPSSIVNATNLKLLCLSENRFEGKVPINLGNLPNLRRLEISGNFLGRNSTEDLAFVPSLTNCSMLEVLDFSNNNFGGELPRMIGNLSTKLQRLTLCRNQIYGEIPVELGNLVNLYMLNIDNNNISGNIPTSLGELKKLQGLYIQDNRLSGSIPSTIYNIPSLHVFVVHVNYIEGTIPLSLGNCSHLVQFDVSRNKLTGVIPDAIFGSSFSPVILDFSHNSLTGNFPFELGQLKTLTTLNVSYNKLSGEIPGSLGDCSSLEYLILKGNSFQGSIPSTLASLKGLQYLDLSRNHLTGGIPRDLKRLMFLKFLNISSNDLEGEVPSNGVFGNVSLIFLDGNKKLCGGIAELGFHPCIIQKHKSKNILVITVVSVVMIAALLSTMLFLVCRGRIERKRQSVVPLRDDKFINVSFRDLHRATGGFSKENLIGSGGFGLVFKGVLDQLGGRPVAVKVIDLQKNGASTSFRAECRALRNIRHRNILPIITYCSSIDGKGQEFKAIVYEFMQNGSLNEWLRPDRVVMERQRNLNLIQRLNILIDVATALNYLHNETLVPIVHCDLKPSNVLLDNELTAHVSDFGLAKFLVTSPGDSFEQGTSCSMAIKGSIGYAAPEYGMGSEASTEGDVYSYGIFLLEMFTGRRPTNDTFSDQLDLHNFVKMNFPEQVMKTVHPSLGEESINLEADENIEDLQKCLISIFKIGLKCSVTLPKERMNMHEVMRDLLHIKDAFFGAKKYSGSL